MPYAMLRRTRTALKILTVTGAAVAASTAAIAVTPTVAHAAGPTYQYRTFAAPSQTEQWTVPPGVSSVHIRAIGASGADGDFATHAFAPNSPGGHGGLGAVVEADVAVTAGQVLNFHPGGKGDNAAVSGDVFAGGRAGTTDADSVTPGTGNGGGASVVWDAAGTVLVAAAGGGGGGDAGAGLTNNDGGDAGNAGDFRGYAGHGTFPGSGGNGPASSQTGGAGGSAASGSAAGAGGGGGGGYRPSGNGGGAGGSAGVNSWQAGGAGGGGAGGHNWAVDPNATYTVATSPGDGGFLWSWYSYIVTSGTLTAASPTAVIGVPDTLTATLSWNSPVKGTGTVDFGYRGPAGDDVLFASWDLSLAPNFPSVSVPLALPLGTTQVFAQYSGDGAHTAWKSSYLTVTTVDQVRALQASPANLDFGNHPIGSTSSLTTAIVNSGNVPFTIAGVSVSDPSLQWTAGNCPTATPIAPGAACTITMTFHPTAAGLVTGTLQLSSQFGDTMSLGLQGTGVAIVAAPTVVSITPKTGPKAGGTTVTISGANFVGVTAIKFGSRLATYVVCPTSTTCTATSPSAAKAGIAAVRVVTAAGTSKAVAAGRFKYV